MAIDDKTEIPTPEQEAREVAEAQREAKAFEKQLMERVAELREEDMADRAATRAQTAQELQELQSALDRIRAGDKTVDDPETLLLGENNDRAVRTSMAPLVAAIIDEARAALHPEEQTEVDLPKPTPLEGISLKLERAEAETLEMLGRGEKNTLPDPEVTLSPEQFYKAETFPAPETGEEIAEGHDTIKQPPSFSSRPPRGGSFSR